MNTNPTQREMQTYFIERAMRSIADDLELCNPMVQTEITHTLNVYADMGMLDNKTLNQVIKVARTLVMVAKCGYMDANLRISKIKF